MSKSIDRIKLKQEEVRAKLLENKEKVELATMGAVIVKHSDKMKYLKKKAKDDNEEREFQAGKRAEAEAAMQAKIQEINRE